MKKVLLFLFITVVTIKVSVFTTGCANIIPPQGGDRDSLPPALQKVTPGDSTRNFNGNKIEFEFDEFIGDMISAQQELLISPIPKTMPSVTSKLRNLTVKWKDSLEANTTYTINFGNTIKDINESNVLKDFTYTFTTGSYFDSLELRGNVILAETGKVDTTLIVMLHSNGDDSAVVNEKPRYVTRLDSKGNFHFKNLPAKTYYLYALKDDNRAYRYFGNKQVFGFAAAPVVISDTTNPVTLYAFGPAPAAATGPALPVTANAGGRRATVASADRRLRFSTNLVSNQQDLLNDFVMSFEQPLRKYDSTKVGLFTDSTYIPVKEYSFQKDSTGKQLKLVHTWKESTTYHFIFDKEFAEDSAGKKLLKTDTLSFATKRLSDYGQLKIKFRNLDLAKNPVLIFLLNGNVTRSIPMNSAELVQPLFFPGDYELRILYDDNKNGKWDPGEFFGKKKQPELVKPVERKIIVKPNWENEFEIAL